MIRLPIKKEIDLCALKADISLNNHERLFMDLDEIFDERARYMKEKEGLIKQIEDLKKELIEKDKRYFSLRSEIARQTNYKRF